MKVEWWPDTDSDAEAMDNMRELDVNVIFEEGVFVFQGLLPGGDVIIEASDLLRAALEEK